jgi:hypothetical protein
MRNLGYLDDRVNVIWHYHEFVQGYVGKPFRQRKPTLLHDSTDFRWLDPILFDTPK